MYLQSQEKVDIDNFLLFHLQCRVLLMLKNRSVSCFMIEYRVYGLEDSNLKYDNCQEP